MRVLEVPEAVGGRWAVRPGGGGAGWPSRSVLPATQPFCAEGMRARGRTCAEPRGGDAGSRLQMRGKGGGGGREEGDLVPPRCCCECCAPGADEEPLSDLSVLLVPQVKTRNSLLLCWMGSFRAAHRCKTPLGKGTGSPRPPRRPRPRLLLHTTSTRAPLHPSLRPRPRGELTTPSGRALSPAWRRSCTGCRRSSARPRCTTRRGRPSPIPNGRRGPDP